MRLLDDAAPKYAPDAAEQMREMMTLIDSYPPRSILNKEQKAIYDRVFRELAEGLQPIRQTLGQNAAGLIEQSGFGELDLAIEAGILKIDPLAGASIGRFDDDSTTDILLGLLGEIQTVLESGVTYPLFGAWVGNIYKREAEKRGFIND